MKTARFCRLGVAAVVAAAWLASPARAEDKLWTVDFDEAKAAAAKDKKDILMEFTGSDWCPPCIALKKNVLDKEAFQSEAPKHFVLLKLDNPEDKSKQTDKEIEQYKALSKKHNVEGVPTVLLADASGRPYAKLVGYNSKETAEDYTKRLVKNIEVRKKRDEHLKQAESAEGIEKAKLLAQAIDGIDADLALSTYRDTVDEIIRLDASDEAKLKSKYENLIKLVDVKKQLEDIERTARDPKGTVKKIEELIEEKKLSGEALQEALFFKAVFLYPSDKAASRKTFEQAAAAAPDTERAEDIKELVEKAFKDEPKEKKNSKEKKAGKEKKEKK